MLAELEPVVPVVPDAPGDKPVLLVIDDNPDIRALLVELLQEEYNVITACDGAQGVKMASKYVPDLVVCDVMMPGMDGLECCRILKSEVGTSHIPVLMLTACSLDEQRASGYDSGADGYLSKPSATRCSVRAAAALSKTANASIPFMRRGRNASLRRPRPAVCRRKSRR